MYKDLPSKQVRDLLQGDVAPSDRTGSNLEDLKGINLPVVIMYEAEEQM